MNKLAISTLVILTALVSLAVNAQQRTALVIGNGMYDTAPLKNPLNDAQDVASALRLLDFEVLEYLNADRKDMRRAMREFGSKLEQKGGVGLFYYAGHGLQIDGRNFLVPLDIEVETQEDVLDEGVDADYVLEKMKEANNDINIVILDACRNNPFESRFRSATRGLTRMEGPTGSLIAFATSPGDVADDGNGKNGLYTRYFLDYMMEPGLTLEQVFKSVRVAVEKETQGQQVPWESSSLKGDFYFINNLEVNINNIPTEEEIMWNAVKDSDHKEDLSMFVQAYPNSVFVLGAKLRIAQIERAQNNEKVFGRVKSPEEKIDQLMLDAQSHLIGSSLTANSLGQAYFLYEDAVEVMPDHPRVHLLKRNIIKAYEALARLYWEQEDYELSRKLVTTGLKISPNNESLEETHRLLSKQDRKRNLSLPVF